MDLADFIDEWLRREDRTPTWLARRAGWSHSYMLRVVNRKRGYYPSLEKLAGLAAAMGCSVHTLVDIQLKEYRRKELDPPAQPCASGRDCA